MMDGGSRKCHCAAIKCTDSAANRRSASLYDRVGSGVRLSDFDRHARVALHGCRDRRRDIFEKRQDLIRLWILRNAQASWNLISLLVRRVRCIPPETRSVRE